MAASTGSKEEQAALYNYIDGCSPDKYIDQEEEKEIIAHAATLNIWAGQAEAMLNHRARRNRWTRESDIVYSLRIMLEEATKDDGVIDKKEFDHIVGYAVAMRMPRKAAIRNACVLVREYGWQTKDEGMLKKTDWLSAYEAT